MNCRSKTASRSFRFGGARQSDRSREAGFSLLEIAVVVGLLLIAATMALELVQQVTRSVHLQQTAANYSNLLQQARVRAVQDDKYYTVIAVAANSSHPAYAYIDIAGTGTLANGDPQLIFNNDVKPMSSGSAPDVANLEAQFLPSGTTGTINTTASGPTFGPRGLPCSPTTSGSYTTCPSTTPTSYMAFVKNTRSLNWEAITVTPAGRIRLWSHTASNTWSPMN